MLLSRLPAASTWRTTQCVVVSVPQQCSTLFVQKRFASDKAIRTRMEAVGNIKKITKAMKMVASAKLRKCEEMLKLSRAFGGGILQLWGPEQLANPPAGEANAAKAASTPSSSATSGTTEEGGKAVVPNSVLVLPITPDRGLCGSVSSSVSRATKGRINELHQQGKEVMVVVVGEKARASLERNFYADFLATIADHSKLRRRTFKQSLMIAQQVAQQPFESAEVLYNQYKNMISFETRDVRLLSFAQATADPAQFEAYEVEGDADVLQNLYDFTTAVRIHLWLAESDMVEFSQRVNSMGNSSKSAEDMLNRLKLLYNRTRQSRITTELVEIISGAAAADDAKLND